MSGTQKILSGASLSSNNHGQATAGTVACQGQVAVLPKTKSSRVTAEGNSETCRGKPHEQSQVSRGFIRVKKTRTFPKYRPGRRQLSRRTNLGL